MTANSDMKADCREAFQNSRLYHSELRDIYRYYMPFRQSTAEQALDSGGPSEGQSRTNHLFDGSGLEAAFNFAGTMQADWMPPFEEFFKLEAGPLIPRDARPILNKGLGDVTGLVHGVLPRPRLAAHEMMLDLFAGTGAMNMSRGNAAQPVRAMAVPASEVALEDGPWGDVWRIWWKKNYKARLIPELWPDAKISDELNKKITDDRNGKVEVVQYTHYDSKANRWKLDVWTDVCKEEAPPIWEEQFRTSRWVTPRFFKVPGETFGRGLAHLGLPFVKTANKAREFALKAAAFSILGLWMYRNDSVFNPDTVQMVPGAMWKVGSTGGALGPALSRLNVPQDFDVSSIVMADEREQINRVLLNNELPELEDRVRSPTEIAARLRKYSRNKGGTGSRIALELVTPIVQNSIDILESAGQLATNITIDQLLTQVTVTSPAAAGQRADKVERAISWISMILSLFGPEAALVVAKVEELLPDIGRWMGMDERFIRSKGEQGALRDLLAQIVARMQQEAKQGGGGGEQPAPQQQYVNGGAM